MAHCGQIQFDGLLEGPMLSDAGFEKKLRAWVVFAGEIGLAMELEIDGSQFSLLADTAPVDTAKLGADACETVSAAVTELLKLLPLAQAAQVTSTLRSTEYKTDSQTQTLFVVAPDGTVAAQQRTVDAETHPAPHHRSPAEIARLATGGLLLAAALLAISALFIDYRALFRDVASATTTPLPQPMAVDASAFAPYFTVEGRSDGRQIVLTLRRTVLFPTDEHRLGVMLADPPRWPPPPSTVPIAPPATAPSTEPAGSPSATTTAPWTPTGPTSVTYTATETFFDFEKPTTAAAPMPLGLSPVQARLAADAIARGYVHCELFDADGRFLGSSSQRIKDLGQHETMEIVLPLPTDAPKVSRLTIAY